MTAKGDTSTKYLVQNLGILYTRHYKTHVDNVRTRRCAEYEVVPNNNQHELR